jgi:uncharacterized protein (UPF0276 family)
MDYSNFYGVSLKSEHYKDAINLANTNNKKIDFFEIHSENYFCDGGMPHYYLEKIALKYPLSFHGVGLSIGSLEPLNKSHLKKLKKLNDKYKPYLMSEHLSFSNNNSIYFNDLLPIEYTQKTLDNFSDKLKHIQDYLGRQILIENPSSYINHKSSTITEWDFFASLPNESGCGLLLDVNNVHISCFNHNYNEEVYLKAINKDDIKEIHIAGFFEKKFKNKKSLYIDDHGSRLKDGVWELYKKSKQLFGNKPTLLEWDSNIPTFDILINEITKARKYELL